MASHIQFKRLRMSFPDVSVLSNVFTLKGGIKGFFYRVKGEADNHLNSYVHMIFIKDDHRNKKLPRCKTQSKSNQKNYRQMFGAKVINCTLSSTDTSPKFDE